MKTLFAVLALVSLVLFQAGCSTVGSSGQESDLPWNEPAGWENNGFGIPM